MEAWENKEVKWTGKLSFQPRSPWGGQGKQCRNKNRHLVRADGGVSACCWEGLWVHLHQQQQPAWQGCQELVWLISASAKPLRSFCLHSKVTHGPHIFCEPSALATHVLAYKTGYPYLRSLSLLCVGLQTPRSFLEGLPAQQHKGAFSSTDLAFVPQGLILWCCDCFVPLWLTESLQYKCKSTWRCPGVRW